MDSVHLKQANSSSQTNAINLDSLDDHNCEDWSMERETVYGNADYRCITVTPTKRPISKRKLEHHHERDTSVNAMLDPSSIQASTSRQICDISTPDQTSSFALLSLSDKRGKCSVSSVESKNNICSSPKLSDHHSCFSINKQRKNGSLTARSSDSSPKLTMQVNSNVASPSHTNSLSSMVKPEPRFMSLNMMHSEYLDVSGESHGHTPSTSSFVSYQPKRRNLSFTEDDLENSVPNKANGKEPDRCRMQSEQNEQLSVTYLSRHASHQSGNLTSRIRSAFDTLFTRSNLQDSHLRSVSLAPTIRHSSDETNNRVPIGVARPLPGVPDAASMDTLPFNRARSGFFKSIRLIRDENSHTERERLPCQDYAASIERVKDVSLFLFVKRFNNNTFILVWLVLGSYQW